MRPGSNSAKHPAPRHDPEQQADSQGATDGSNRVLSNEPLDFGSERLGLASRIAGHIGTRFEDAAGRVLYFADLALRESQQSFGHNAKIDLRGISQSWLAQSVAAWARHGGPHNVPTLYSAQHAWSLIDEILTLRGTPPTALVSSPASASEGGFPGKQVREEG